MHANVQARTCTRPPKVYNIWIASHVSLILAHECAHFDRVTEAAVLGSASIEFPLVTRTISISGNSACRLLLLNDFSNTVTVIRITSCKRNSTGHELAARDYPRLTN
ncbi:unnamed protein product [Calypogeia fissa]